MTGDRSTQGDTGAANLAFARALVGEMRAHGLAAAWLCPGSRSTPLALAVADCDGLPRHVMIDERAAAFHALGHARATGRPVLLVCTSGTAGANFLPAVAEASQSRVPLVVATADRPPELRAWGAPQTMEQRHLYAGYTRHAEEAPCPSERPGELRYARALARRAIVAATGDAPGPVHLNLPFREPLLPATIAPVDVGDFVAAAVPASTPAPAPAPIPGLGDVERGVLVFGPDVFDPSLAAAVAAAARVLGWPVVADPGSGLRAGGDLDDVLVHGADLLLRVPEVAEELRPQRIVRCGGTPTSAAVVGWIARHESAEVWLVDPADGFRDPQHRATRSLRMTAERFCSCAAAGGGAGAGAWLEAWQRASRIARDAAGRCLDGEPRLFAPQVARTLWERLPDGAQLYAANSMPVRDVDAFAGPRAAALRVLVNRGVNGIDGMVSSALGAAESGEPTVLWCGDLALLHDAGGLLAGRHRDADLTVVVTNDDGGGIFENLPVARLIPRERFEELFAVPHGMDLAALARGMGWDAVRVADADALGDALRRALAGGLHLIEVPVDRAANTEFHRAVHSAVAAALRARGPR